MKPKCKMTTQSGTSCKKGVFKDELCNVHYKQAQIQKQHDEELELATKIDISPYNLARIEFLLYRPEYNFTGYDSIVDWLFRKAKQKDSSLRFLLDVFEENNRNRL